MRADLVTTYLETFEKLRSKKSWSRDTTVLRFVALALGSTGLEDPYARLEEAATTLRKRAGWTSPLRSEIRYLVAAMILCRGLDPARIHARIVETREAFRSHRIPRSGTGPTLAALLLALHEKGAAVPVRHVDRLARIYRRWKDDHFWLTGANDLPAAAVHAMLDEDVDILGRNVERAYQKLRQAGFGRGDQLQLVSQFLAVDPRGIDTGVLRFTLISAALKERKMRVGRSRYDEVAVLALTPSEPTSLVDRVLGYRDRLRGARSRPSKDLAFSLATGIALAEDAKSAEQKGAGDLATLRTIQTILDAQQAAMAAAVVGASAGASASAGSC